MMERWLRSESEVGLCLLTSLLYNKYLIIYYMLVGCIKSA